MDPQDEVSCHLVGQLLDGGLGSLRLLHQVDDLRQGGLPSHLSGAKAECAGFIHSPTDDLISRLLLHGHAFAGKHRLVHRRVTLDDNSVDRNSFSRPNDNQIIHQDLIGRQLDLFSFANHSGDFGLQRHQPSNGVGSPPTSQRLQPLSQNDEGCKERRRLKEDRFFTSKAGVGPKGIDNTDEVSGSNSCGIEKVHIRDAMLQAAPAIDEKLQTWAEDHRGCEDEEGKLIAQEFRDKLREYPIFPEGPQHDKKRQRPGDKHPKSLVADVSLPCLALPIQGGSTLQLFLYVVTQIPDRLLDLCGGNDPSVVPNRSSFGTGVGLHPSHSWQVFEPFFDHALAMSAAHSKHRKAQLVRHNLVTHILNGSGYLLKVSPLRIVFHLRLLSSEIDLGL